MPRSRDRDLHPCRTSRLSSPVTETSCIPVAPGTPRGLQGCCGVGIGICRDAVQQEWIYRNAIQRGFAGLPCNVDRDL